MTPRRWLIVALAAVAVLLLAGRALAEAYVDYSWFAAMGASEVWRARTTATLLLHGLSGIAATLFVFVNLYVVRQSIVSIELPRRVANLEIREEVSGRYLIVAVIGLSLLLGALLTIPQEDWSTFVLARIGRPFGETDPYFGADLGFFVYWLPFERAVYTWTLISLFIVSAIVLFLYALTPSLRWERGTVYVSAYVRRHLTVLAGVLLLMLAWSYRLDMYAHLTSGSGPEGMFTYLDHKVGIPGSLVLAIVTFGAALIVVWGGWTGQLRLAGSAVLGVLVLSLIIREAAPFLVAHVSDDSDPAERDVPYREVYAGYTRRAFGVDRVGLADSSFGAATLADAARTVPVWDEQAILRAVRRTPGGELALSSFGWHAAPTGVVVDVPERPVHGDSARLPWGVARLLATTADAQGAPVRVTDAGTPSVQEAQLQGAVVLDTASGWAILPDSLNRVVGTPLEGTLSRLAHAWSFQLPELLFADAPQPHPTVVLHRAVRDRLHELAPFFAQGSFITPMVLGDSLFWCVDLYSASASYPLSRRTLAAGDLRTYFQHAATGLILAATGETWIVPDSVLDPIAATWVRRFPTLFSNWSALPAAIAQRLPPALDAVQAQAISFGRFGGRAGGASARQPPILDGADSALAGPDPLFALPARGQTALAVPLLDASDQVRGLVVGIGGRVRRTVWYPLAQPGARWTAVIDRLRGIDSASAPKEGPLFHGAVHAYPIAGSIAYVQSTYLWRPEGPPTLARVSFLWRDSVRTAGTLAQLAGAPATAVMPSSAAAPLTPADFRARVQALYRAMRDALRRGDFAAFGRALDELGRLTGAQTRPEQ